MAADNRVTSFARPELFEEFQRAKGELKEFIDMMLQANEASKKTEGYVKQATTIKDVTVSQNALVDAQGRLINTFGNVNAKFAEATQLMAQMNGHSKETVQVQAGIIRVRQEDAKLTTQILRMDEQAAKTRLAQLKLEREERMKAAAEEKARIAERQQLEREYTAWWETELKKRDDAQAASLAAQPSLATLPPNRGLPAGAVDKGDGYFLAPLLTPKKNVDEELARTGAVLADTEAIKANTTATEEATLAAEAELTVTERLAQTLLIAQAEINEVNAALKLNQKSFEAGTISEAEYVAVGTDLTAQQAVLKANISDTRSALMAQTKSALATGTSMKELGLQVGILREQYRSLTAAERQSAEGRTMLSTIQQMDGEIKRLDASIGNSQRNVGNYASAFLSLENIGRKLITSFGRMAIHFIAFTVIMEGVTKVIEFFTEKIKDSDEGVTEYDKEMERSNAIMDKWNQRKQKQIQLLQQEADERQGLNVSGQFNTTASFEIRDMERKLDLLKAQQETGKNALKDKAANIALDKQIFDLEQNITRKKIEQLKTEETVAAGKLIEAYGRREGSAVIDGIKQFQSTLEQKRKDLENQLKVNDARFKRQEDDKFNPYSTKKPHDFFPDELKAENEYTKALYDQFKQRSQISAAGWKAIGDDETNNLQKRADAYTNYTAERLNEAGIESAKEQAIIQNKLDAITEIEKKPMAIRKDSEKKLLLEKQALEVELVTATEKYEAVRTGIIEENVKHQNQLIKQYGKEAEDAIKQSVTNLEGFSKFFADSSRKQSYEQYSTQKKQREAFVADGEQFANELAQVNSNLTQRRVNEIDAEIAKINERRDAELAAAEKRGASEQEIADIKAKAAAQESKLDLEKHKRLQRAAVFERSVSVVETIAEGSLAAMRALSDKTVPYPIRVGYAVSAGLIAAAKVAVILSTPLPQYEHGTRGKAHRGGDALLFEGNKAELVLEPGEKPWIGNTEGVYDLAKGSHVVSNQELMQLSRMYAFSIPHLIPQQGAGIDLSGLESKMDSVKQAIENKPVAQLNVTGMGMRRLTRTANEITEYVKSFSC